MNWLDWLLLITLLFFTVASAIRGFAREVVGLAATVLALVLALWFYGEAGAYIGGFVSSLRTANLLGFLAVFFAVMLCGRLFGWMIQRLFRSAGLSFFDRLLGAGFGAAKGLVVCVALVTAFMAFGPIFDTTAGASPGASETAVLHSRIAPWVLDASRVAVAMAPMELKSSFRRQYDGVRTLLSQGLPADKPAKK